MNERSIRLTHVLIIATFCAMVLVGCANGGQSTPEQTTNTLKSAIKEENWNQLYHITHPTLRGKYIHQWRSDLRNLLKNHETTVSVDASDVDSLTNQQIFRTYLEILSRDPKSRAMINAYQKASYQLNEVNQHSAVVSIESNNPLPIKTVKLSYEGGQWVISTVN